MAKIKQEKIILGIGKETVKGTKVDVKVFLPETPLQRATRDFMFEVAKSLNILWIISKIKFLKYKNWVKVRMEEYDKN